MTARARRRWTTLRLGFRKIAPHAVERGGLPDENPRALGQFNGLCHSLGGPPHNGDLSSPHPVLPPDAVDILAEGDVGRRRRRRCPESEFDEEKSEN